MDVGASEDEDDDAELFDKEPLEKINQNEEETKNNGAITEVQINTSVDDTRMIVDSTALPSDNGIAQS